MKKLFIILTVLLVLGSSCEDFLTVNEKNPNSASAVPANLVLPAALNSTANIYNNPGNHLFIYVWHGCMSIYGNYAPSATLTQYNLLNSSYQGNWANTYINLQNYDYIEKVATDPNDCYYKAISMIMKAYQFQNLVDAYGDVPYSEALKSPDIIKPKYDDQQEIYEDLVLKLDEAMDLIANAPVDVNLIAAENDIMFAGNIDLWWKFANTVKLRILVNQSGMSGRDAYITSAIGTQPHTTADYLGAGESALVNPGYVKSAGKMNPFWETFYKQDDSQQADGLEYFAANQDACDFLDYGRDPRSFRFFKANASGVIRGNYYAVLPSLTNAQTSALGPGLIRSYDQNAVIMTDFESLFLQAEAAYRGYITGDAKALYESAVTQSIIYMGGPDGNSTAASNYLTSDTTLTLVNWDYAPNKIQTIITQKWCALNGISAMPLWTDFRRTGYPDFIHYSTDPQKKNATPPVRLLYPQTELDVNNEQVNAVGTINAFTSKIFWQNR